VSEPNATLEWRSVRSPERARLIAAAAADERDGLTGQAWADGVLDGHRREREMWEGYFTDRRRGAR